MKITKIEKKDNIYFVTRSPNFIQRLFGIKEKIERYKHNNEVFSEYEWIKVFFKSTGEPLTPFDKTCEALNNFDRSF